MNSTIASRRHFRFRRAVRQLWVRATFIAVCAVFLALSSRSLAWLVPDGIAGKVSRDVVVSLLQVMASSMLAVTIFSLSVIISARQSASSQVTPRSHQVLMEDRTTQNVLAVFLGSFIFSLAGVIILQTGFFAGRSVGVMLFFTLAVILCVILAILRWIEHLAELGSVTATNRRIENAAAAALDARYNLPCLGARPLTMGQLEVPARAVDFRAWDTGYVQHIDLKALSRAARETDGNVYVIAQPGELVSPGDTLVYYTADIDEARLKAAFTLSDRRVFEQDPRFGVIVLSEIAQRALSPGVNDPGTAIDIITRFSRLLANFKDEADPKLTPRLPHIWMSAVTADELVRDAFDPIARDGAGSVEVQMRIQKTLCLLAQSGDETMKEAARAASARALEIALPAQVLEEHRARLLDLAAKV